MRLFKKIILGVVVFFAVGTVLFVAVIGPWPVYKDSQFAASAYCKKALADIDKNVALSDFTATPGVLKAGWGTAEMTPKIGTPLGGLGARKGKPSTGVHDPLYSKAICLSDGKDTVALIGDDMLIVPPNIADLARRKIAREVGITANNILFCASHTHSGTGAFAPGLAGTFSSGKLDPAVPEMVSTAMADAVIAAFKSMAPAKLADGQVDAPEFIRNRTRDAATDSMLKYLVVEKLTGEKCFVIRYSAHPTIFGDESMVFSAEFPGALQRYVEAETKGTAIYLGGAVGSMGPKAPEAPTPDERVDLMGKGLARKMLDALAAAPPQFKTNLDIASVGVPIGMPAAQMRPMGPGFRVSPMFAKLAGIIPEGWIQGIRVGDILFVGLPYDTSGEMARQWREEMAPKGWDLWVHGFSGAYCGYLSPDKYYYEVDKKGSLGYENGFMSWFGPNAEAYMRTLRDEIVNKMGASPLRAQNGAPLQGAAATS
jgi:hypothetical protein